MDKITESIAHFIGLFHMEVEQARGHKEFAEFQAAKALQALDAELKHIEVDIRSPHELEDMDPGVRYTPAAPEWVWALPWTSANFDPPYVSIPLDHHAPHRVHLPTDDGSLASVSSGSRIAHEITPPGSIVELIRQTNILDDSDFVSVGDHGLTFTPIEGHGATLNSLLDSATPFSPIGAVMPGSAQAMTDFIVDTGNALKTLVAAEQADGSDDGVFAVRDDVLEGTFVNGEHVAEAPKLEDHMPAGAATVEDSPAGSPDPVQMSESSVSIAVSVEVNAGGNSMMNTAFINNSWLSSTVMAAVGNHVEINAIVQSNVWSDVDAIGASVDGWKIDAQDVTDSFNIAMFTRIDPGAMDSAAPVLSDSDFPKNWAVTTINGDLITMNWVQQFSFVTDDDIHVLSASGARTTVTTGENILGNDVSLQDLGLYYDLIIVGGSLYDGNFIQQMNVLLDDDFVAGVSGFETNGNASLSTSGNLLWNEASITNIGGADRFEALPDAYKQLAADFASGSRDIPLDVLLDPAFAGLAGIRVLYITGNVIDLQYISQVNVLGDADQVALAMNATSQAFPEADWTVSTGSNALVNVAQIIDVDTMGKTYVGGDHYSDEILIQAELVSNTPQYGTQSPDQLVNEAVAFLTDDDLTPIQVDDPTHMHTTHDCIPADPMQSVVS